MEKASNHKDSTKLSKMLQKALSIGHSATPFSPARDFRHHRTSSTANRGLFFSSPLVSTTARVKRRTKNHAVIAEPTSPKVSCIGQIKLAKPKCPEKINRAPPKNLITTSSLSSSHIKEEDKGRFSKLKRLFSTGRTPSRKAKSTSFAAAASEHPVVMVEAVAAPSLGKMKKFASSRETLGEFDWTIHMKREEPESDRRRGNYSNDEDVMIPYSVMIPLSQSEGLNLCPKSKSEVNLWKRRTMDRPKLLQVKTT